MRKFLTTSPREILFQRPNTWLELIAQNIQKNWSDWSVTNGIAPKIPPSYDATTSWFKYDELIEDWPDVAVLDTSKQGPALKNKLRGNTDKYRGLLNRDALKAEDGVKYFRDKLRPHFVRGAYSVFLWRLHYFFVLGEETLKWSTGL